MVLNKKKGEALQKHIELACGSEPYWDVRGCLDVIKYFMQTYTPSHQGCIDYGKHESYYAISLRDYKALAEAITCPIHDVPMHINNEKYTVRAIVFWRLRNGV